MASAAAAIPTVVGWRQRRVQRPRIRLRDIGRRSFRTVVCDRVRPEGTRFVDREVAEHAWGVLESEAGEQEQKRASTKV